MLAATALRVALLLTAGAVLVLVVAVLTGIAFKQPDPPSVGSDEEERAA